MLENLKLEKVIFIDVETVPQYSEYKQLSNKWKELWDKKANYFTNEDQSPEDIYNRAGIYAEFGKVICISVGLYRRIKAKTTFRVKSFFGDNEKEVLKDFCELLNNHFSSSEHLLCAHNGKEFDFPFLARRILINGLKLPNILDIAGRKPWEVQHLDTLQLWKFGDYKHYTSLDLLTHIFNIPSPKNDMDGSDVAKVYWEDKNLDRIVKYCQNDTLAVAQLLLRFMGKTLIKVKEISYSNS